MVNDSIRSHTPNPQFVMERQNDQDLVSLLINEIRNTVTNPISLLQNEVSELRSDLIDVKQKLDAQASASPSSSKVTSKLPKVLTVRFLHDYKKYVSYFVVSCEKVAYESRKSV